MPIAFRRISCAYAQAAFSYFHSDVTEDLRCGIFSGYWHMPWRFSRWRRGCARRTWRVLASCIIAASLIARIDNPKAHDFSRGEKQWKCRSDGNDISALHQHSRWIAVAKLPFHPRDKADLLQLRTLLERSHSRSLRSSYPSQCPLVRNGITERNI
jgi:hypothetical protein